MKDFLTYNKCQELYKKARWCKLIGQRGVRLENNTYLIHYGGHNDVYTVKLHRTDIIKISKTAWTITHGGWTTKLTADRVNKYSMIDVFRRDWEWYYHFGNWETAKQFPDPLVIYTKEAPRILFEHLI